MLKIKSYILYFTLVCFSFGCDNMYPKEKVVGNDLYIQADSTYNVSLDADTLVIWVNGCPEFKVKRPYSLIQWNDSNYGILLKYGKTNLFKVKNGWHSFTSAIEDATHFKDSCDAKNDLYEYLGKRVTYKIVK